MKLKIALVVQRYGTEVIGGAERLARLLAEKLSDRHEISVLTTCALDYRTWANHFPPGQEWIRGIRVIRWPVKTQRRWTRFGRKSQKLFTRSHSILDEYQWILDQGPEVPELIEFITSNSRNFDLFLFFTYLYYPTFFGFPAVAEKSILMPAAHDEPPIRLAAFKPLFHLPRFIAFSTEEEREFVHRYFQNSYIPNAVIGIGVDLQPVSSRDDGYFLYAGRVEKGKGCEELFEFAGQAAIQLKVIGQKQIAVPSHVDYLGYVDEEEKNRLISGCSAVIVPSKKESLSLAALEAWAMGKPVIAAAGSPVLKGHLERSGGGYGYSSLDEFRTIVGSIDPQVGQAGRDYVEKNYSWDVVLRKYEDAFSYVKPNA
ncbi:MAG: glycosyltransferase family 4 protein [Acidobacteriota bacterium]